MRASCWFRQWQSREKKISTVNGALATSSRTSRVAPAVAIRGLAGSCVATEDALAQPVAPSAQPARAEGEREVFQLHDRIRV